MSSEVESLTNLEKLLRDTEFENTKLLGQINEEKQVSAGLESQIIAQNAVVLKLEKSITKLQEETEKLNDQVKTNKEVALSFRKSSHLVDRHIDQMQNKLEEVILINQKEREKQKCLLSNYSLTWLKYKEKWEIQPLAIRMKEAKCKADVMEKEFQDTLKQIEELRIKLKKEEIRKETEIEEHKHLMAIIVEIAKLKTKTNHMFPLLEEKRNDLTLLKSQDQELQEHQKQQQGNEENLTEIQATNNASKQLGATCLEQSCKRVEKQIQQPGEDTVLQRRDSPTLSRQGVQARLNMPNRSRSQISVMKKFMEIKVPAPTTPFRSNRNSASNMQGENDAKHLRNLEPYSLQLPSRAVPSISANNNKQSDSVIQPPQTYDSNGQWEHTKSPENVNLSMFPSISSIPNLLKTPSKDESEPKSTLKSDRSLMKAPSKGSPGLRKSKTPFDRKNSGFNKLLTKGYSPPKQSNMSPENNQHLPSQQVDKLPTIQANSPVKVAKSTEDLHQRTSQIEEQGESSFAIIASSNDNVISADQNPLCFSSQSEGTGSVSAVNAVDGAFNSDGFNLHIDQHTENIKNLTKSPGDGFLMASRPMFQHCSEEKEQQHFNGQAKGGDFGGFFASTSFINPGSMFSFGNSSSPAQSMNENTFQINADSNVWSQSATAPSFQQDDTPNAFSFLGSSVSGNQNDIGNSPGGFHFGFSSEASSSNNTGFSLF